MNQENLKVTLLGAILVVQTVALATRPAAPAIEVADSPPAASPPAALSLPVDVRIVGISLFPGDDPVPVWIPGSLNCEPKRETLSDLADPLYVRPLVCTGTR